VLIRPILTALQFNQTTCFVCSQSVYSNGEHGSGGDGFPFQINQHTGDITTGRALDREVDGGYFRFIVSAGDVLGMVGDRATVRVHVTDRNEHSPTFVFPACGDDAVCEVDVMMSSTGDVMTRVIAVDADDVTQRLRYELMGGGLAERLLGINSTSGEVYARQQISRSDLVGEGDDEGRIRLKVRVTDSGVPPLSSSVVFSVRFNLTGSQQTLGVNERPTSTSLALPFVLVAGAAAVIMVVCFLAARRIGPMDRTYERTYVSATAPVAYVSATSIDDVACGADCSTDVALGSTSTLRLQVNYFSYVGSMTHFVLVESPFVVEPTAGRFGCRRKNVDNKPRHVDVCTRRQFVQHNGCKRLPIPLPHSSHIISDEKRIVGGLSQQQQRILCCLF